MPRTRRRALTVAAFVVLHLLAVPVAGAAPAADQAASIAVEDGAIVLAVEVDPEAPLPGPEPDMDPETNPYAPGEYEAPWLQWIGAILTLAAVLFILGIGVGYWLLVKRPEDRTSR
jgi:hypothetical protein